MRHSRTPLGIQIEIARRKAGLSQARLAEAINVDYSTVSKWESGDREPGISSIKLLADRLGVPVGDLLE